MTGFLDHFISFLLSFGVIGLGVLAIVDSTIFFFLPFAQDALLIILVSKHRNLMLLYSGVTVIGSVIGSILTYVLMRKASKETIEKTVPKRKLKRVQSRIEKGGFIGLVIASILPPPFPYTPFVVAAAVSDLSEKKTFAAIVVGRSIRYFGIGVLALLVGRHILRLLEAPAFKMFMLGLFLLAIIGSVISIYKWVKR
jgi:membrane protein YqaA with SNARE-associated domain